MRYLPLSDSDRADMLRKIGVSHVDDLFADIPADKLLVKNVDLPVHKSEIEVEQLLTRLAAKNLNAAAAPFFLGGGAYRHHIPASVDHLIQRSEFLTAYTPYQPEIAQGTLQMLFEFQTQVAALTGMEVANASMYDGSTGTAEAIAMARRITRREKAVLSGGLHPHYVDTAETLARMEGHRLDIMPPDVTAKEDLLARIDDSTACIVVQSPDFFGNLRDTRALAEKCQKHGALLISVFTEVVSLGLVESPGAMGADIVVGEGQSLGVGLNYGGPYVGLFSAKQKYLRQMPGRLCGETTDAEGHRGFVLTLSTREQHIRREKATSNICTNSGLCALAFSIHMSLLGEKGLRRLARQNHAQAVRLAQSLSQLPGIEVLNRSFFNEFTIKIAGDGRKWVEDLAEKGILAGIPVSRLLPKAGLDDLVLLTATELNTDADFAALTSACKTLRI